MTRKVRIVATVISDLVTDQRVHKVCTSLSNNNYDVFLIGSKRSKSLPMNPRKYKTDRIALLFQGGFLLYAEFNLRLFFKLLFCKADIFLGNDLDVMPATWLVARLKNKPIVYDTHEYFLGMPELKGRHFVQKVWTAVERFIFPRLQYVYTICQSFCDLYEKDYGKKLWFIRNVPFLQFSETHDHDQLKAEIDKKIPRGKHLLIFQGAGINVDRGAEELVMSTKYLDPEKFHFLLVGGGDIFHVVEKIIADNNLNDRITIIPKVPFEVLRHITKQAELGFTVDKPNNINHIYGLPNKIFDYLHAGVPVLSTRLIELESIIEKYDVGTFLENNEPQHIAERVNFIFDHPELLEKWKKNSENVKKDMNWENEEKTLLEIYSKVCRENNLS
jgi:glycosyltransferase involved in cell wall biosynthesis